MTHAYCKGTMPVVLNSFAYTTFHSEAFLFVFVVCVVSCHLQYKYKKKHTVLFLLLEPLEDAPCLSPNEITTLNRQQLEQSVDSWIEVKKEYLYSDVSTYFFHHRRNISSYFLFTSLSEQV